MSCSAAQRVFGIAELRSMIIGLCLSMTRLARFRANRELLSSAECLCKPPPRDGGLVAEVWLGDRYLITYLHVANWHWLFDYSRGHEYAVWRLDVERNIWELAPPFA